MSTLSVVNAGIAILDAVDHLTPIKFDDKVVELLKAVRESPALIACIDKLIAEARAGEMAAAPSDPFPIRQSLRGRRGQPDGAEAEAEPDRAELGERAAALGEIMKFLPTIMEYLPAILAFIKAVKDSGIFKKAA